MAKSFKKFRDEWDDDEWGDNDDDGRNKDHKLKSRREKRRNKISERLSTFDETDSE